MSAEYHSPKNGSRGAPDFRSAGSLPAADRAGDDPGYFVNAVRRARVLRPGRSRSKYCGARDVPARSRSECRRPLQGVPQPHAVGAVAVGDRPRSVGRNPAAQSHVSSVGSVGRHEEPLGRSGTDPYRLL